MAVVVTGCRRSSTAEVPAPLMTIADLDPIRHPPEWFFGAVAWLEQGMVVSVTPAFRIGSGSPGAPERSRDRLLLLPEGSSAGFEPIALPEVPGCRETGFDSPQRLPDGRLGYAARCLAADGTVSASLRAHDLGTGRTTPLHEGMLPPSATPYQVAWSRDLLRGVTSDDDGNLLSITPQGSSRLDVKGVNLDFAYGATADPRGERMAFSGSADPRDGERFRQVELYRANQYVSRLDGTGIEVLWADTFAPGVPAWSPDGRWLFNDVTVERPSLQRTDSSLWLIDATKPERRRRVLAARVANASWSPDGRKIAVVGSDYDYPPQEGNAVLQLYIVDVAAITGAR